MADLAGEAGVEDMKFIHLHTPDGLGISLRLDVIVTVEQLQAGGALIRLRDGQWRSVGNGYANIIEALEKEEPLEETD